MRRLTLALPLAALLLTPVPALAQGDPGNPGNFSANPHPMMPWFGVYHPNRINYGSFLRYIEVPAEEVVVEIATPTPGSEPVAYQPRRLAVPGYTVIETSTGFYYPPRWVLERLNVGVYQWRVAPATFRYKTG